MCSLWTQPENSTGSSIPLVAMLLVPNVESKADLLIPWRNLDFSLRFGIFFVLPKSTFDRSSSSLRIYNIYINIYNIYINRPKQLKSSLAASTRAACSVLTLNDSQLFCLFTATQQLRQEPIPREKPFQLETRRSPPECRGSRVYSRPTLECYLNTSSRLHETWHPFTLSQK